MATMLRVAAVVLLLGLCSAQLPTDSSLKILAPQKLKVSLGNIGTSLTHSEALFGIPKYNGFIATPVRLPITGQEYACNEMQAGPNWGDSPVVLVERGNCTFTKKVFNAQNAGAAAVLIADDHPLCFVDGTDCPPAACTASCPAHLPSPNPNNCECFLPTMADDGQFPVTIPSMLITRHDANAIKSCVAGGPVCGTDTEVILKLQWSIPAPDNRVEWSIWSSANDRAAEDFREQFLPVVNALGTNVQFTPHYFIFDGEAWTCTKPSLPCSTQCTNAGKYCEPDPDGTLDAGVSGADVVRENLRQLCVFQQANETVATDNLEKYWTYTRLFTENCKGTNLNMACSKQQVEATGLSWSQVEACVANSGGSDDNGPVNTLLEQELNLRRAQYIVTLPSIVVDEEVVRSSLTAPAILGSICAGFSTARPEVCACKDVDASYLGQCVKDGPSSVPQQHGGTKGVGGGGLPGWATAVIVILILVVIGLAVGGFIAYRRANDNMRSMLDDYRRLDGDMDDEEGAEMTRL